MSGKLKIDTATGKDTTAQIDAVYLNGAFAGLARGHADPSLRLVGNVSASFSPAGGLTGGKIGDSAGGGAIALGPGKCSPPRPEKPAKAEATGSITALSTTSIGVAGLTCTVPAGLAARVAALGLTIGSNVAIRCENGVLVKISAKKP